MNALANENVGNYLNKYFVSSFQRVGTFKIVNGQKQGGNVASYFCMPDGRVLDVVAGPVFYNVMRFALQTLQIPPTRAKPPYIRLTAP